MTAAIYARIALAVLCWLLVVATSASAEGEWAEDWAIWTRSQPS